MFANGLLATLVATKDKPRLRTLLDMGRSEAAMLVFKFMRANGLEVNTIHCNVLLNGMQATQTFCTRIFKKLVGFIGYWLVTAYTGKAVRQMHMPVCL